MVTALVVVAGSGFIIGTAHEKKVTSDLLKEMKIQADMSNLATNFYYADVLSSDDPSDSQRVLEDCLKRVIRGLNALKKLPQDHHYAEHLRVNAESINYHVQRLEQEIAEQAAPSDGDKP
ncbi:MAG: hypothetical protein V4819_24130 [Verrucomicrobiota bacterium]